MSNKNRNIIIAAALIIVFISLTVFSRLKNPLVRQLQGPTEGTNRILTVGDRLCVVSKENHIYTWQWNDLSIWPVVARPRSQVMTPIAGDKIIYNASAGIGKLIVTDLKADKELTNLSLPYGAECEKIKTSSNGKVITVLVVSREGSQKGWSKLGLVDSDLKNVSFVFQKNTDSEGFLLYDFAITNEGNLIAGAGEKNHAWVFITDVKDGNIPWEKTFPEYGQFTSVEFSPDGKTLFVSERVRHILVFDTITGQLVNKFVMDEYRTSTYQKQNICCIAISPDGRTLAADTEPARTVWFWDIKTGKKIASFYVNDLTVSSIAFSPDSKYLATGCLVSPEIKIWKVPQLKP